MTNFRPDFLIIPYQLIENENLTPLDRILYGVIYYFEHMRYGKCIVSNKTLMEYCNVKRTNSIKESLLRLEENRFIKREYSDIKTNKRSQIMTLVSYKNSNPTPSTQKRATPSTQQRASLARSAGVHNIGISKNTNKVYISGTDLPPEAEDVQRSIPDVKKDKKKWKEKYIESKSEFYKKTSGDFDYEKYVDDLIDSEKRMDRIIGLYFRLRNIQFPSFKVAYDNYQRNLKPASILADYDSEDIKKVIYYFDGDKFGKKIEWTLETAVKFINKPEVVSGSWKNKSSNDWY